MIEGNIGDSAERSSAGCGARVKEVPINIQVRKKPRESGIAAKTYGCFEIQIGTCRETALHNVREFGAGSHLGEGESVVIAGRIFEIDGELAAEVRWRSGVVPNFQTEESDVAR